MVPRLIFCLGGNEQAMQIARDAGWEPGSRSSYTLYPCCRPLTLLDIDWKKPDWKRHLAVARQERPWLVAVPDVERLEQVPAVLAHAEEIAPHCDRILVIPKAEGVIESLPREIGGKLVVLGYSVPTKYGGTSLWLGDFTGWPVHLLGGSPRKQRQLCDYLHVVSTDGNMAWKIAGRCASYNEKGASGASNTRTHGKRLEGHGPYEALKRSLTNLVTFWRMH
jgi:hypothetical protein